MVGRIESSFQGPLQLTNLCYASRLQAELIGSLTHKLETLQEAKGSLLMDIKLNNALGEEVEALISELCKPNEFDKYKKCSLGTWTSW